MKMDKIGNDEDMIRKIRVLRLDKPKRWLITILKAKPN